MDDRAVIEIKGRVFPVSYLEGKEVLAHLFSYHIGVQVSADIEIPLLCHVTVNLYCNGLLRVFTGIVTDVISSYLSTGKFFKINVEPRLSLLQFQNTPKLFQELSVMELIKHYLHSLGYKDKQISFSPTLNQQWVEQWLQLPMEMDLDALWRLLSDKQLYIRLDCHQGEERLMVVSCHDLSPTAQASTITYIPASNMQTSEDLITGYSLKCRHAIGSSHKHLQIKTRHPMWQVGYCLELKSQTYAGSYRIKEVLHHLEQSSQTHQQDSAFNYWNELTLEPASEIIELPQPPRLKIPLIPAKTVSQSNYPHLDHSGAYAIQLPFIKTGKLIRVNRTLPSSGSHHGTHFPLPKQTRVLVAWRYDDIRWPAIIAALPSADQPSPVTQKNPLQAVMQSQGGNQLVFNQAITAPSIDINNANFNTIQLTQEQEKPLTQVMTQGVVNFRLGERWCYEVSGNDRQQSQEGFRITTGQCINKIFQQALDCQVGGDSDWFCQSDMTIQTQTVLNIDGGMKMNVTAIQALTIRLQQGNATIHANNRLFLQSQQALNIVSDKAICIHDDKGVITLTPDGEIIINTQQLKLHSQQAIEWQGKVLIYSP